jgi:hypothetical protein
VKYILVIWYVSSHGVTAFEYPALDLEHCNKLKAETEQHLIKSKQAEEVHLTCRPREPIWSAMNETD